MARLIQPANAGNNTDALDEFTPVPAGDYPVVIQTSEFKATKAGTGHYLKLKFKIIDGEQKGRFLWENLNLDNPNPVAVEIANKALNTICKACGKVGVQDSEELHGIPMIATVSMTAATKTQPASNSIKFYKPIEGSIPAPGTDSQVPTQQQAIQPETTKAPAGKLPWE